MDFLVTDVFEKGASDGTWNLLWYQYIEAIGRQCVNPDRKLRAQALNYFQRVLLSQEVHSRQGFDWIATFDRAIFPLIATMLKPEVYEIDPNGMAATRLQGASLLCKIFLQYVIQVQQHSKDVLSLWIRILDTLDRLVNSGQRDSLKESVVESLKNVILVVSSSEFGADEEFWDQTWKRLDSFVPGLKEELFPAAPPSPPAPPAPETTPQTEQNPEAVTETPPASS
ncbi:hypothetical protein AWJ20_525 [Sugiyamaella lignohabitans]|uniref:GBF1-like tetratricopeptide repeats domain-containing protein n=1 Tax=Sugiyamaella lignohabitans TaxID=796027 RepID=A0A167CZ19_9ASCO|nr:uncharacterized protein AWJ20_525 [Sugiyamaella lignohabitans]ANB12276.1 hypothetical protein AWJ20_525 [Sugiyamaella lignohabitans]